MDEALDGEGNIDPLAAMQHTATYQQHLASLTELVLGERLHLLVSMQWQVPAYSVLCECHVSVDCKCIVPTPLLLLVQGLRCTASGRAAHR